MPVVGGLGPLDAAERPGGRVGVGAPALRPHARCGPALFWSRGGMRRAPHRFAYAGQDHSEYADSMQK